MSLRRFGPASAFVLVLALTLTTAISCAGQAPKAEKKPETKAEAPKEQPKAEKPAETPNGAGPRPGWPKQMTMGSASIGGVYFVWGGGWAKVISEKIGIPTNVEVTGGPVHNIQLVSAKQPDLGMVTNAPAWEGWHGKGWAKGQTYRDIRALFPMYSSGVHWYALEASGIKTMKDFQGKSVGVGPVGGTPGTYLPLFIEAVGVKPRLVVNAGYSDIASQLADKLLDAAGWIGGLPLPSLLELEASHKMHVFGFTDEEAKKICDAHPYFAPYTIKAGTYKSLTKDIEGLAVFNFSICHKDMPEDLAYELVKTAFENKQMLVEAHKAAQEMEIEQVKYTVIPFHKGAIRYYKEKGITMPDQFIPPEA